MKILCELLDKKMLMKDEWIAGWIIGIEGLSLRAPSTFSLSELEEIIAFAKSNHQIVTINARRVYSNQELEDIIPLLDQLAKMGIDAYFYSDFGFYQLANERNLSVIYQASTYLTNQLDVNLALSQNDNVVIATEITVSEMQEIAKNAIAPLIIEAFGRTSMFHSRRPLLSSYFAYRKIDYKATDANYTIVEEIRDAHYPIEQDKDGTHIYRANFSYLLEELKNFENVKYIIINTRFLSLDQAIQVLKAYIAYLDSGSTELKELDLPLFPYELQQPSVLTKERG